MNRVKGGFAALRGRRPLLDHLVRTVGRYQADAGDRLAASVTFYWFLSLFPILLVAIYVFRLINGDSAVGDVQRGLSGYLPPELVTTISTTIGENAGKAGLVGVAGLVVSGLGWIDALREAIRSMWHQNVTAGNLVVRKLIDVGVLVGLFAMITASVFLTGLAASGPRFLLEQVGVDKSGAAVLFTKVLGVVLAGLADVALFLYLFVRLARVSTPVREVLKGAAFGAVGFGVLKVVGAYYVQRTTTKGEATYGTFAVVVGLLLFLNLLSRVVLFAAAFAVTGPYDSDTRPSGTADREQARKAGIPPEYADRSLNAQVDGAPTPLVAAVQGRIAPQDELEGVGVDVEQSWSRKGRPDAPPLAPPLSPGAPPPGQEQVLLAARLLNAAGALVLFAVATHVVKTLRGLLRR